MEYVCGPANDVMRRRFGLPVDLDVRMRDELRRTGSRQRWRLHDGLHPAQLGPAVRRGLLRRCRGSVVRSQQLDASTVLGRAVRQRSGCRGIGGIARDGGFVGRAWGLPDWVRRRKRRLGARGCGGFRGGGMAVAKKASS